MSTMNGTTSPEAAVIIHELTESERQADMTFKRLCLTIDQMLYEAKQALDQSSKPAGVKVLSSFDMCKLTPTLFVGVLLVLFFLCFCFCLLVIVELFTQQDAACLPTPCYFFLRGKMHNR